MKRTITTILPQFQHQHQYAMKQRMCCFRLRTPTTTLRCSLLNRRRTSHTEDVVAVLVRCSAAAKTAYIYTPILAHSSITHLKERENNDSGQRGGLGWYRPHRYVQVHIPVHRIVTYAVKVANLVLRCSSISTRHPFLEAQPRKNEESVTYSPSS